MYADGAASPNPGTGGYGIVLVIDGRRRELSGGFRRTTNNRMELMGVIVGLRTLQSARYDVTIYSDSKYVVDMFAGGYATAWRRNGWTRNHGRDPVLNPDLWGELLDLAAGHKVQFVWVRGHSDNMENTRCDEMAVQARQAKDLPVDAGYEKTITPAQPSQLLLFGFP
ncbi:MAG: ribonuclease H [bacterium]